MAERAVRMLRGLRTVHLNPGSPFTVDFTCRLCGERLTYRELLRRGEYQTHQPIKERPRSDEHVMCDGSPYNEDLP